MYFFTLITNYKLLFTVCFNYTRKKAKSILKIAGSYAIMVKHMRQRQINLLNPENSQTLEQEPPKRKKLLLYSLIGGAAVLILSIFLVMACVGENSPVVDENGNILKPKKFSIFQTVKNFIFSPDEILEGQRDDRVNILLMGIGGPGHDGPYLSDTNIILSVKPSANEVAMISVPRDLAADIEDYGIYKINHANAYGEMKQSGGGGELARQTFEKTFNLDIPYYVRVDFQAFKEIIDIIGGVDIDIPRGFVDYSFPGENNSYKTVFFKKGLEHMDGERALTYARSRHGSNGEGSDFARAARQQLVMAAAKEKLLSAGTYLNPVKIQKILDSLSDNISTNLNIGQLIYLAGLAKNIERSEIKNMVLSNGPDGQLVSTTGEDGAYLLIPKTGSFDEISASIIGIFNKYPENTAIAATNELTLPVSYGSDEENIFPQANILIENGTWQVGLASRFKKQLEEKGFGIYDVGNSAVKPVSSTAVYVLKQTPEDLTDALAREFQVDPLEGWPEWLNTSTPRATTTTPSGYENINLLVILGLDKI